MKMIVIHPRARKELSLELHAVQEGSVKRELSFEDVDMQQKMAEMMMAMPIEIDPYSVLHFTLPAEACVLACLNNVGLESFEM